MAGFVGSFVIAGLAYWKRSLSASGLTAAILLGTGMYALGSLKWYGLLIAFFVSSSFLSHRKKQEKKQVEDLFAKGGRRDWLQVAANGGAGLVAVSAGYLTGDEAAWYAFYIGTIAAVSGDTWATEIGVLSRRAPRHILTWKKVEAGASGGVSGLGMLASLGGGLFIGFTAVMLSLFIQEPVSMRYIVAGAAGGLVGSVADSVMGATWQRMYYCEGCRKHTERPFHCGEPTRVSKGYNWCTNDVVNVAGAIAGGWAGWLFG